MSPYPPRAVLRLLPDESLSRLAAGGSEPAFDVLYARYAAGLTAACRRILRNDEDAHDALQSTMLKAWASLDRRGDAPLRPWLYRIAHNESVSLLRRRRPVGEIPASAAAHGDVHAAVADRDDLAGAISGIGALPARQRKALLMRVLAESSYDDIAASLQTSPAAARQSVTSARRTLRRRRLAGVLPIPAWLAELAALANSGSTALTAQATGRAAATLTAAVATFGVVHGPPDRQAQRVRAGTQRPARTAPARTSAPAVPATTSAAAAAASAAPSTRRATVPATARPSHHPASATRPPATRTRATAPQVAEQDASPDEPADEPRDEPGTPLAAGHGPAPRARSAPADPGEAWSAPDRGAGEIPVGPAADEPAAEASPAGDERPPPPGPSGMAESTKRP